MTREEAITQALEGVDKSKCIILELGTGFGKSKNAIDCTNKICDKVYKNEEDRTDVLILVDREAHKLNFRDEIKKWGGLKTDSITIECYASIHKYEGAHFDVVICDEGQHLSPKRIEILKSIDIAYNIIVLSATLPRAIRQWLTSEYTTTIVKSDIVESIESGVLPDPTIYMIPMEFSDTPYDHTLANPNKGLPRTYVTIGNWHKARYDKLHEVHIICTDREYYRIICDWIDYCKQATMSGKQWARTKWQKLCGDRLLWLSDLKTRLLISLQEHFKNYRMLTFCGKIDQANSICKYSIHSKKKNKENLELLKRFNDKKIKHICSVNMLNEGMNLTDCRIAIIGNINSSDIIIPQRIGRALRHKKPIIIIPYFTNTREQEILQDKLKDYNKELIKVAWSIDNINIK